jgi:hypothetical protein
VTWGNGGPHGAQLKIADKDEVPGSSPGRPTTVLPAQSAAAPRPVAPTACLGRVGAARPPRRRAQGLLEQATQRPSHGRPRAGEHVPDDLRAAMPQVGEPGRVPGSLPRGGPCPTGSSWSARRSSLAAGRGPPCDHGQADASVGPARPPPAWRVGLRLGADDQPVVDTGRGDHADSGRPRHVAARRKGALDELIRFGHSRGGNARIADAGCPDARTPNWTPDTGHRTPTPDIGHPDAWTPTPDTGHWTPVAWTPHAWTLDLTPDTGRRMLPRTGQADKVRPAPDVLGHAERLPAGMPNRVPADGACGARRPLQARR